MIKMLLMQVRLEDLCKEKRSPALALQFTANPFLHTLPSVINEGMAMESEPSVARVARNWSRSVTVNSSWFNKSSFSSNRCWTSRSRFSSEICSRCWAELDRDDREAGDILAMFPRSASVSALDRRLAIAAWWARALVSLPASRDGGRWRALNTIGRLLVRQMLLPSLSLERMLSSRSRGFQIGRPISKKEGVKKIFCCPSMLAFFPHCEKVSGDMFPCTQENNSILFFFFFFWAEKKYWSAKNSKR